MTITKEKDLVQAVCLNGHLIRMWGSPLMIERNKIVRLWGSRFECGKCGAPCKGGF